jgi:cell division protein ZipA
MPELRWILLVVGALLVAGLWWWELKRSRGPREASRPEAESEPPAGPARHEPRFAEYGDGDVQPSHEMPSIRIEDRPIPSGDPPVLTIDDLPEDTDRVVLAEPTTPGRMEPITARRDAPGSIAPEKISVGTSGIAPTLDVQVSASREDRVAAVAAARREPARAVVREPPVVTTSVQDEEPLAAPARAATPAPTLAARTTDAPAAPESRRPAARPAAARPTAAPPAERTAPAEPPSTLQKIVALRLVSASGERIDGARLRAALEAEGMRFGKYSIFHRQRADGRAIYSVASLLEPGSFDLDRMGEELYPGVSMFAVFPGPLDAPEAFDEMLATTRRLSERLGVVPQDERGGALNAPRALQIREELVHFQGLVDKTRSRQNG